MRKLVVYYSLNGNTEFVAEKIAMLMSADLLKLQPEKDINPRGFGRFFWGGMQAMMKKEPKLLPFDKNPSDYDFIFIGTPVWAWTFTPPIRAFLSKVKLSGKKIALFCTCEDLKNKALENMREALAGNEIVLEKKFISPIDEDKTSKEVKEWLRRVPIF